VAKPNLIKFGVIKFGVFPLEHVNARGRIIYVSLGLIEIMPSDTVYGVRAITKLCFVIFAAFKE